MQLAHQVGSVASITRSAARITMQPTTVKPSIQPARKALITFAGRLITSRTAMITIVVPASSKPTAIGNDCPMAASTAHACHQRASLMVIIGRRSARLAVTSGMPGVRCCP